MASSKVMATTSTTNPDLTRQSTLCPSLSSLLADLQNQNQNQSSDNIISHHLSMDDILKNIYSSPNTPPPPPPHAPFAGASVPREDDVDAKSVDEVWKEIVAGGDQRRAGAGEGIEGITLEDFLTKAGAVSEEDVRAVGVPVQVAAVVAAYGVDSATTNNNNTNITNHNHNNTGGVQYQHHHQGVFGNSNNNGMMMIDGVRGGGRGKRRAIEEPPVDKATQQKQRRMIKNRESAARSRERKQAYTVELESLVTQLEEENSRLLKEEAKQNKEKFKQLMENIIPVVEKQRPPRVLRRVHSMQW